HQLGNLRVAGLGEGRVASDPGRGQALIKGSAAPLLRQHLRALTEAGAAKRWPGGVPDKWRARIEHELALIEELGYEHYFLTVADIVQ
ncbi:hypothetical protein, partial [Klebsiella pneumoniae]|uniref:hypothetical protein n=1 Tax=Klebsiella pneumoniae TaxID=573 RepID=UPI002730F0A6